MKIDHIEDLPSAISVEDFVRKADSLENLHGMDGKDWGWSLRYDLLALSQNKDEIFSIIRKQVKERLNGKLGNWMATYYYIHLGKNYNLRATIWLPENMQSGLREFEGKIFAYNYPHNHNFDLITANVSGPGYETDIYTINSEIHDWIPGDLVSVEFQGRQQLSLGTVLFYEAFKDVHSQVPVDEISVALNLMPPGWQHRDSPQHDFSVVQDSLLQVSGSLLSQSAREVWAARILGRLENAGVDVHQGLVALAAERQDAPVGKFARDLLDASRSGDDMETLRRVDALL